MGSAYRAPLRPTVRRSSLPYEIVKERLELLAEDKAFSYRMRRKFVEALEVAWYRSEGS